MDFSVDIVFRIAAIGIAVAVLSQILTRAGREDQALLTTIAGILVVIFLLIDMIAELFSMLRTLFQL